MSNARRCLSLAKSVFALVSSMKLSLVGRTMARLGNVACFYFILIVTFERRQTDGWIEI